MEKIKLGNTTVQVSALCLGTMYLGTRQNQEESFALLDQYYASGGNFIDTANIYAHWVPGGKGGESETVVGNWIKSRQNRDQVFFQDNVFQVFLRCAHLRCCPRYMEDNSIFIKCLWLFHIHFCTGKFLSVRYFQQL